MKKSEANWKAVTELHAMEKMHRRQKNAIFVAVCRTLEQAVWIACDCGTPHPLPGTHSDVLMCVVREDCWANECAIRRNPYIPPFAVRFYYSSQKVWYQWYSVVQVAVSLGVERDFLYHPQKQALVLVVQNGSKTGKLTPYEGRDITQMCSSGRILYHTSFGIIWCLGPQIVCA